MQRNGFKFNRFKMSACVLLCLGSVWWRGFKGHVWPWVCAAMPTSSLVLPTVGRGDASPLRRTTTLRSVASSGSLRRRVAPGRPELAVGGRGAAAATVDFRQLTEPSLENREPLCWRFIFLPKWDLLGWDGWLTSWLVGWLVGWLEDWSI